MDHSDPRIEPLPRFERDPGVANQAPWHRSGKVKLFSITFGLVAMLGIIWTLMQPVIYRSSATVLMSSAVSVDAVSDQANVQNVAIQRTILLGEDIIRRLQEEAGRSFTVQLDTDYLKEALLVEPLPDTNLIEMIAQGTDEAILPSLVSVWIDVYMTARAQDVAQSKGQTIKRVQDELDGLTIKIELARDALELYREQNDIISAKREENEVLARLDGLNKALNNAIEEEVKTKVYLETLREAIGKGQVIVPEGDMRSLQSLESELGQLRAEMLELSKRYTKDYIEKQPALRAIPERIAELEAELASRLSEGQSAELANAEQAYSSARRGVVELQRKLDEHKRLVFEFNRVYATDEALVEDLAGLEELNRETQERLVQVQVRQVDKYPQVTVIEPPREAHRTGPNYLVMFAGTLGAALACGIFSVWLLGFLGPDKSQAAYVTLSGVHLYPREVSGELAYTTEPDARLAESDVRRLQASGASNAPDAGEEGAPGSASEPGGERA